MDSKTPTRRVKRQRFTKSYSQMTERVLYVHPAKQGPEFTPGTMGRPYGVIPMGVPALVNVLRDNGIPVKGLNYPLEMQLNSNFSLWNWLKDHRDARVVLIDLHWYEHCYGAVSTARFCKEALPGVVTVLGGLSASGFSQEILANFPEVDFIIRGDAEKPLLQLVQELLKPAAQVELDAALTRVPNLSYRKDGAVVENELTYCAASADLDQLNFADIDFLEHFQEYYVHEYIVTDLEVARLALESNSPFWGRWLTTARGCKYECSYCGGCKTAHQTLAGRIGLVERSPEKVVQELARLRKTGVVQASLSYDIAELGEAYWQEFFRRMRDEDVKIGLYNEFFQIPQASFINDFARTAVMPFSCVALSPLSGNERVRRLNGKHFSNSQLFDTLDQLAERKSFLFIYFSLNLPGETNETLQETVQLAREIYDFYPSKYLKILNTAHTVDPLSPMALHPDKYGVKISMSTFKDFYEYCVNTRFGGPDARTELYRGFTLENPQARSVIRMADSWDASREGHEKSWWPVPPSW